MSQIPDSFDLKYCQDKQTIFDYYCRYTFTRTQSMFVYENLPDSIPVKWLEHYLQRNGSCCIAKVNGELYALLGSAGGEPDEYYQPTKYVVSNPALNLSEEYEIGTDCVYCKNDFMGIGLVPLVSRYCGLMAENVLTIRQSDVSMRNMFLLSAPDDNTLQSTKHFVEELEAGRLSVVGDNAFFDGVKMQSSSHGNGDYMIQFIELQQYLKGSMYNELGLNANFNMKREALSGDEIAMNDDALMPLIDDMLKQRRDFVGQLNDMFGLDISVDFGSTWHSNVVEKAIVADEEYGATPDEQDEMGGDESNLPDDASAQDVSQLNTATDGNSDADVVEDTGETAEENQNVDESVSDPEADEATDDPEDSDTASKPNEETDASDVSKDSEQGAGDSADGHEETDDGSEDSESVSRLNTDSESSDSRDRQTEEGDVEEKSKGKESTEDESPKKKEGEDDDEDS